MKPRFTKSALAVAVLSAATGAMAQEGTERSVTLDPETAALVLEEVIVTAQLRTESLQDVPVSVNAVNGAKLMEAGLTKIEDLQSYMPNLTMSETGIGTNVYIRGIGSGINQGFEQSVGMYVDGVYYGRAQLSRAPFLDIERIEVLRGPQNILYGKNSIAGAISIATAKPSLDRAEAYVSVTHEPDNEENVYDLVMGGPIADNFGVRIAIRKRNLDGYIKNENSGFDEPDREEETARIIYDWLATDSLTLTLKLETGSFDVRGRQIEIVGDEPSLNPALNGVNWSGFLTSPTLQSAVDVVNNAPGSTTNIQLPTTVLDTRLNGRRHANGDYSKNDTKNGTLIINYNWNDYTFTSITGHLQYDYDELCDCDFVGTDIFYVRSQEEFEQQSQEFRIVSPVGDKIEWLGGAYWQSSELIFRDSFIVTNDSVLPSILEVLLPLELGALYPAGSSEVLRNARVPRYFTTDTDLYSVFAQFTYHFSDTFRATFGGRYTYEEKEASRVLTGTDAAGNEIPVDTSFNPGVSMGVDYLLGAVFNLARHDLEGKRDGGKFAPLITLEYVLNDDMMSYFTWSRGFKSGGYDARSNAPDFVSYAPQIVSAADLIVPAGSFEFDDEEAQTLEFGLKASLADGAAELNAALFFTEYDDLQVSIYDGRLGFNVGNAAGADVMGLELDGRWLLAQGLTLTGSLAWLDFEFTDYKNGQCTTRQSFETGGTLCDYTGETNQYVADYSGSLSLDYVTAVNEAVNFRVVGDVVFSDDYNPSQDLDPAIAQDAYYKFNARIAFSDSDDTWELAVIGKNLTDEEVITYANDTSLAPLIDSVGFYTFVEPGRTFAFQGTYRF